MARMDWSKPNRPAVASTPSPTFRRESRRARLHRRRLPPLHPPARRRRPGGWGSSSLRRGSAADDQRPGARREQDPRQLFPSFWDGMSWGFGVGVQTEGPQQGRYGWSGGQGTDFFVDQDGPVGILFTHVELGQRMSPLLAEFKALHQPT